MKRPAILGIAGAAVAVMALTGSVMAAAPDNGATKYTWATATTPYAGPAAMIVNKAGAIVWWHNPGETTIYKDVYRFHAFDGATFWGPVSTLNAPVNGYLVAEFPENPSIWYTREVVDQVPGGQLNPS